jgi:NCAIR mutase (PurE)-related protein
MTIDERLEKLTERHEALAQAMELNASLQRDNDQRTRQAIDALIGMQGDHERRINEAMKTLIGSQRSMMDAVTRLSNIVADHDIRLDGIEGRA